MKKISLIFLLASGFIFADAQTKTQLDNLNLPEIKLQVPHSNFSLNQKADFFKKFELPKKNDANAFIITPEQAQDLISNGTFSHYTLNGSAVYVMNTDNMPCLVPNMKSVERMLIDRERKKNNDRMRNAIPEKR